MKIIPFPKDRKVQASPKTLMPRLPRTAQVVSIEVDDFSEEIEVTRLNQPLMAMLGRRARHGADVSLEEVKKRIATAQIAHR